MRYLPGHLLLVGFSGSVRADEDYGTAKLVISNRPGEHIGGLTWKTFDVPVRVEKNGDERRAFVDLSGTVDRQDANLVHDEQSIPLTPNPEGTGATFSQPVPLKGKITGLTLFSVDPYGQTQTERAVLVFPKWQKFNLPVTEQDKVNKRFLWSAGLGVSYLDYNEPGNIQLSEYALTGKVNVVYLLKPHQWELGGNAFVNLVPVTYSPSDRASARWWGINGRVGYHLPIESVPSTSFWLMTGWYFWGMFVNADPSSTYGVSYLGGPQIFVTARITPPGQKAKWVYLKFASIQDHLSIFSTTNRELAAGGGTEISERGAKHPVSLTLDIAEAKFAGTQTDSVTGLISDVSFRLFSLTAGVSVGL